MSAHIILTEICPYCTKRRFPSDFIRAPGWQICHDCYQRHLRALTALSTGQFHGECSECHKTVEELTALQANGDNSVRMAVIYEDGFYRMLCPPCEAVYVPKRREFFKGTAYAKEKGLN